MKKFFYNLFGWTTYTLKVEIILKSGRSVFVSCDDIEIKRRDGTVCAYTFTGPKAGDSFYISIDEIAAIQYTRW